ncbi:hypothetical protein LINPERHAP2_LOCUS3790 [Linum perenne]
MRLRFQCRILQKIMRAAIFVEPEPVFVISASEFSFSSIGSAYVSCKLKPQVDDVSVGGSSDTMTLQFDVKKIDKFLLTIARPDETVIVEVSEKEKIICFKIAEVKWKTCHLVYRKVMTFTTTNMVEKDYLATVRLSRSDFYYIVAFLRVYPMDETRRCFPRFKADLSADAASDDTVKVFVSLEGIKFSVKGYTIRIKNENVDNWNVKKPLSFTIPVDVLSKFNSVCLCSESVTISAYPQFPLRLEFTLTYDVVARYDLLDVHNVNEEEDVDLNKEKRLLPKKKKKIQKWSMKLKHRFDINNVKRKMV